MRSRARLLARPTSGRATCRRPTARPPYAARRPGRPEEPDAPRVDRVALRPGLHPVPLVDHHGPAVADQLSRELGSDSGGEELRGLDLLRDDEGLRLGAGARLVVAREGEEDDEPEQYGEPGRQDAEDAGRAVPVREVASLGRPPADEQHHSDRERRDSGGDEEAPEDVHPGADFLTSVRPDRSRTRRRAGFASVVETERAGFEPATQLSPRTRFPVALLRPLGHLSERANLSARPTTPRGRAGRRGE